MHNPPRILIVDDNETNRDILVTRLDVHGYELIQAVDGEEALASAHTHTPDLILLDVMMPKLDGVVVTRLLKADTGLPFMPIILVTAKADIKDVVAGLEAGADEYLTKPVDQASLVARVKSMLRLKQLHDKTMEQAAELAAWNKTLEKRVVDQLSQIERISRFKRFLAPQVADLIVSTGHDPMLDSHRSNITAFFCDLRGFTRFAEATEPEELMTMLSEYNGILGALVHKFEATLERFTGDGLLAWFNDPVPCPDPNERAVLMAVEMRSRVRQLLKKWSRLGHELGFGIGISNGYATLGLIGFEQRIDYSAVGSVVNLAARLCAQAKDGQILIDGNVLSVVKSIVEAEPAGELSLKGISRPIKAFNVSSLRT